MTAARMGEPTVDDYDLPQESPIYPISAFCKVVEQRGAVPPAIRRNEVARDVLRSFHNAAVSIHRIQQSKQPGRREPDGGPLSSPRRESSSTTE